MLEEWHLSVDTIPDWRDPEEGRSDITPHFLALQSHKTWKSRICHYIVTVAVPLGTSLADASISYPRWYIRVVSRAS